jgi:hypothetical protein
MNVAKIFVTNFVGGVLAVGFAVVESRDDLTPLYRVGLVVLLLTLLKTGSAIVACGIALPGSVLLELIAE